MADDKQTESERALRNISDAEIAGRMGWRGPGAYTEASMRKIKDIIDHVLQVERTTRPPSGFLPEVQVEQESAGDAGAARLPKTGITAADVTRAQRDLVHYATSGDAQLAVACACAQAVIQGLLSGLDVEQLS